MNSPRYWTIVLLMLLTLAVFRRRGDQDHVPPSLPLATFPSDIGSWVGSDEPIDARLLEVMGRGVFLNRLYQRDDRTDSSPTPVTGPVALFIGYFPTQRTGQSIHSPQNCLPGAGWTFESSATASFKDSADTPVRSATTSSPMAPGAMRFSTGTSPTGAPLQTTTRPNSS